MKRGLLLVCLSCLFLLASEGTPSPAAVAPITSVVVDSDPAPPYDLVSVTVGSYTEVRDNLRGGTTEALPGGNDGGDFFDTWFPPFEEPAPSNNLDIHGILARNQNPNPMQFRDFGGVPFWMDTNGNNPDFFVFEAVAGAFGDTDPTVQAILADDVLGGVVDLTDSGSWGETGLSRVANPNNGQSINGVSFAITDLQDDSGNQLTNSSIIHGLQINSQGLDPSTVAAVMIGLERLSLEVNTTNGQVAIKNNNDVWPITEEFMYYRIESPAGGLDPAGWNSLDDQGVDANTGPDGDYNDNGTVDAADFTVWRDNLGSDVTLPNDPTPGSVTEEDYDTWNSNFGESGVEEPGNGWDESGGVDTFQLIELRLTGQSPLAPGEGLELGAAYNTSVADPNVTFTYALPDGELVMGEVNFVTGAAANAVPEPASFWLISLLLAPLAFRRFRLAAAGMMLCMPLFAVSTAEAVVVHRYTFNNSTADDSVGTAHGELVNPEGTNRFAAGQLNLTGNNGVFNANINSGQDYASPDARGAYVNLPNDIVTAASGGFPDGTAGNQVGAVSVESWFTVDTNRNSARVWHFGNHGEAEDSPTANGGGDGMADVGVEPQAGSGKLRFQTRADPLDGTNQPGAEDTTLLDWDDGPSPIGVQQHVVVTMDHDDLSQGANGTSKVYIDGDLALTGTIQGNPNPVVGGLYLDTFEAFGDINNWLGRSQFAGNPLLDGAINELRIYDHPMTAAEVTSSFNAGPTLAGTPLAPTLMVDRNTGEVTILNSESVAFEMTGYAIDSIAGGLDPDGWSSIADGDGSWTESSATSMSLAESETGSGNAGDLAPGVPLSIGSAFIASPFDDLVFTYTLSDGTNGGGFVVYSGDVRARSDINGDGFIDRADWAVFLANNEADLSGSTPVDAWTKGDLDFDLDNDFNDFLLFRGDFEAANGAGAFSVMLASVPEPSSLCLLLLAAMALAYRKTGALVA